MNRIYMYIIRHIEEDFSLFDLDSYILRKCNISDFIIRLVNLYNTKNKNFQFSNQEFLELMSNPRDLDLICQCFYEKISKIFDIKFKNDLYEILRSDEKFPHKDFIDMDNHIEERRIK